MILGVLLIIGLLVYATWDNCSHGHHEGVCGREYKSGKLRTLKVCDCVKDHY